MATNYACYKWHCCWKWFVVNVDLQEGLIVDAWLWLGLWSQVPLIVWFGLNVPPNNFGYSTTFMIGKSTVLICLLLLPKLTTYHISTLLFNTCALICYFACNSYKIFNTFHY